MDVDEILTRYDIEDNGCWRWNAAINTTGYGAVRYEGRVQGAHRVIYELVVDKVPDDLTLDHLCYNRWCVNPDHLEPVGRGDNVRRGRALITHCPQGHEYDGRRNPAGHRYCHICARDRMRKRYHDG